MLRACDAQVEAVDSAQSGEKEIALLPLARVNSERRIGLVSDSRRMNVDMIAQSSHLLFSGARSAKRVG